MIRFLGLTDWSSLPSPRGSLGFLGAAQHRQGCRERFSTSHSVSTMPVSPGQDCAQRRGWDRQRFTETAWDLSSDREILDELAEKLGIIAGGLSAADGILSSAQPTPRDGVTEDG